MRYLARSKNVIITENTRIEKEDYATIQVVNIGDDNVFINNNINLAPGDLWEFKNEPYVIIGEETTIKFAGVNLNKKVLVEKIYYKEY
jgi:hypothetical protein